MRKLTLQQVLERLQLRFELWKAGPALRREINETFDAVHYLSEYGDVAAAGCHPLLHYLRFGRHEGRITRSPEKTEPTKALEGDFLLYQYAVLEPHFDEAYYLHRYPDLIGANLGPLEHFVMHGAREGRNPSPLFDTKAYRARYKDIKSENPLFHYVTIGKKKGFEPGAYGPEDPEVEPIASRTSLSAADLFARHRVTRTSVVDRLRDGELGRMFEKAAEIDPLVAHARLSIMECGVHPLREKAQAGRVAAMINLQKSALHRPARAVVLIPWNHLGGANKIAGYLSKALAKEITADELMVIQTETDEWDFPHWFPGGIRRLAFRGATKDLSEPDRLKVLFELLRSLDPEVIVSVNSRLFWSLIEIYGQQLGDGRKLFAHFFCNEKNSLDQWGGYPVRKFHHSFDKLDGFLVDSHALKDELETRFALPETLRSRIHVLHTPIDDALPLVRKMPRPGTRPVVYWAGRFDRQKRVDIAYDIARRMPHVEFRMWGQNVLDRSTQKLSVPGNITEMGTYDHLRETDLGAADLWLYTSEWDGVPNMLIEVATTGIPLVGSLNGGTGEILDLGYSYPVASVEDVDGFIRQIETVLSHPEEARAKAAKLRDIVLAQRDPEVYRAEVVAALNLEAGHG
jgi:glycosyltransferase involved in cell wall biosynthesis